MEKEKLEQAKKTFAEDSEKFKKYQTDLSQTTKDVQQEYEKAVAEKNSRVAEIKKIDAKIIQKDMEIKRVEDNLLLCKQRKAFLDELAISAGKKSTHKISTTDVLNPNGRKGSMAVDYGKKQRK